MTNQTFASSTPTLIVVGDPLSETVEQLLEGPAGKIILLEPDPDKAKEIQARFGANERLRVIPALLARRDGPAKLSEYNFPGLRSVVPPIQALRDLFPGLYVRTRKTVKTMTPAQLIEDIGDLPGSVHLDINTPGLEHDILQGWQQAGGLEQLDRIRIRCGATIMFEGAADRKTLEDWAEAWAFQLADMDESDSDWPVLTFTIDQRTRELESLHTRLGMLTSQQEQREAALAEMQTAAQTHVQRIAELEAQRDAMAEAHKQALSTAAAEADAARADLGVAMRMQALAQGDLRNLQERFRDSEQARAAQADLLQKLTPRLQQAAQQLQQLILPAAPPAEPGRSAVDATKTKPKTKTRRKTAKKKAKD